MREEGFEPDIPTEAIQQAQAEVESDVVLPAKSAVRDLRALRWSSIDNPESRDLDQIEVAERLADGNIRVRVGIADVDAFVPVGSSMDAHARANATTVYTGVVTFPMLPETLSTDKSSLLEDVDRLALIIDMVVTEEGTLASTDMYRAVVHNYAKLDYETVGAWLEGHGDMPEGVARVEGMEAQLRLQDQAAQRLLAQRQKQGALDLETIEAVPVVENGQVTNLTVPRKNQARALIENLMVSANTAMAAFLEATGLPFIQRVVRSPERWPRIMALAQSLGESLPDQPHARALSEFLARRKAADPVHFPDLSLAIVKLLGPGEYVVMGSLDEAQGHFSLAAYRYTHSTAPNRRYADLVIQRLLKAVLTHAAAPYSRTELDQIAQHCTEREDAARKVERKMRKVAAAVLMRGWIGEEFDAIVTGVSAKGVFVRVVNPPIEGRVVEGEQGMDVGERVRVRLVATDPDRGYIDFARNE